MQIIKKIIVSLLILLLLPVNSITNVVYAETIENTDEERVRIFRNLAQFFATFFDPDGLFRFTADDIFIKNQCLRRDVFALQAAKNQVSDYLIENYTTITESELETMKLLYATYTSELFFLRNLDLLKNDKNEFEVTDERVSRLRNRVLDRSPARNSIIVNENFNNWMNSYSPRFQQYENCDNSWSSVIRRAEAIKQRAQDIKESSQNLKDAIVGVGQEAWATPTALARNSYRTIRESVTTSYSETRSNFRSTINDFREELEVFKLDTRQRIAQLSEDQAVLIGRGQDLGQVLLENTSLVALPSSIAQMTADQETRITLLKSQVEQAIATDFSSGSTLIFLPDLIDTNNDLIMTNRVLTRDNTGVIPLAKRVTERQCSA